MTKSAEEAGLVVVERRDASDPELPVAYPDNRDTCSAGSVAAEVAWAIPYDVPSQAFQDVRGKDIRLVVPQSDCILRDEQNLATLEMDLE